MSTVTDTRTCVTLDIQGMTCASCAARIEKKLTKVAGVSATVNYATNKALVLAPAEISAEDLVQVVEQAGYGASLPSPEPEPPLDPARSLRRRMLVAAALSVPVVAMAMLPALQFPGWQWLSLALATPVVTWAAWPFHRSALVNLRHGATTMDTLVSLGTAAAYLWSLYALVFGTAGRIGMRHGFDLIGSHHDGAGAIYLEAASGIVTFILLGRYLEARSRREAGSAIAELLDLGAKEATILRDGVEIPVGADQVQVGDLIVVRPGERVAADGVVIEGLSAIDASLVTGESVPVDVEPGSAVVGGTVNTTGRLVVEATRVGKDTQLAQMARLVEQAQTGKAPVQRLADRISAVFVPVVIGLAVLTFGAWLLAGASAGSALTSAVAVLIIACPCALGLATPTALMVGTGRGAQLGIVIAGPEILESTRQVDTIVLDKTGTLTTGSMSVVDLVPAAGVEPEQLRRVAVAVESGSEHPVGRAIAALGDSDAQVTGFTAVPGRGVRATLAGRQVLAGSARMLAEAGIQLGDDLRQSLDQANAEGRTTVVVAVEQQPLGLVTLADQPKPTAARAVAAYHDLGLTPVLLSGDSTAAARQVGASVGIEQVLAEVSPADKVDAIRTLQRQGRTVAMVGDGVNDAAALAQADLGIAMGSGSDAAIAASDLTLMRSDPVGAADAIRLSRATLRTIKTNLFWAFAYNVAAIPVAALGLLNPMIAGAAMAFSSVFVVTHSLRLRRFTPTA